MTHGNTRFGSTLSSSTFSAHDEEQPVTEDGAYRCTANVPGSSSEDVYIGLRRCWVITDTLWSRSGPILHWRSGKRNSALRISYWEVSTGELSRLGSKCDRGDASCLIVIHDGESVHLTETWGCGELSRCKNYEEMVTVHAHSRLTRLSGDILWSGSRSCCQGSWSWTASFHGRGGGGSAVSWSLPRDHFDVWMVSRAPALSWPRSDSVNTYSKSQVASESRALFGQNVGILFQFVVQYRTFSLHLFPASSLLRLRPLHLTHIFKVAKVTPLFSPKVAKIPSDLS